MAKRAADVSSPELESDLAPDSVPAVGDDSVPRLDADDGQGTHAPAVAEYDGEDLHSALANDEGDEADGATDAEAEAPADNVTDESTITEPAATQPAATDTLSAEDRYYRDLGRHAHAERMAALEAQNRTAQAAEDEDDAEIDPEVERLAKRTARIVSKQIAPLIEHTERVKGMMAQAERRNVLLEDQNIAKSTIDTFIKTNALTRGDSDAAELVREEIQEAIDQHFAAAAAGHDVGRVVPQKIIELATKKAARLQKAFANRAVRQTTARTEIAARTRSTAGGSTPGSNRPVVRKTEADRRKEMDRTLHQMDFR